MSTNTNKVAQTESVLCDLCGAGEEQSVIILDADDFRSEVPPDARLRRCKNCGLLRLSPRPTPESIGQYYPPDYAPFRPAIEDEPFALMRFMRGRKVVARRKIIERFLRATRRDQRHLGDQEGRDPAQADHRPQRVLDVGSSTGLFLNEMQKAGWQALGVEPTPSAARYARDRFGLEIQECMLEEADLEAGSFKLITFWDVLEHVFSPRDTLVRSHELLQTDGLLAINIPNYASPERGIFGRHWSGYDPPRHLYVFPHDSLEKMLEGAGFEVMGWQCFMPAYFTFIISIEQWLEEAFPRLAGPIMRILRFPGVRLIFEPVFWLYNRLGLGGVISIFARKR